MSVYSEPRAEEQEAASLAADLCPRHGERRVFAEPDPYRPRRILKDDLRPPRLRPEGPSQVAELSASFRSERTRTPQRARRDAIASLIARELNTYIEEQSLAVEVDGETPVRDRLEKLRAEGWYLLDSIPVDEGIDHLLIGPGGTYAINAKMHSKAEIWVSRTTVMVNGDPQPCLDGARRRAERCAGSLSGAVGTRVPVTPVLVFLTNTFVPQLEVTEDPDGVVILDRLDLPRHFRRQPTVLAPAQVQQVLEAAREPSTWRRGREDYE